MKKAKSVWTLAALVAGVGIGFGMTFSPATAQASATPSNMVECAYDYQCDAKCGGQGWGACLRGRCFCTH